jgi:hypothetical protein
MFLVRLLLLSFYLSTPNFSTPTVTVFFGNPNLQLRSSQRDVKAGLGQNAALLALPTRRAEGERKARLELQEKLKAHGQMARWKLRDGHN